MALRCGKTVTPQVRLRYLRSCGSSNRTTHPGFDPTTAVVWPHCNKTGGGVVPWVHHFRRNLVEVGLFLVVHLTTHTPWRSRSRVSRFKTHPVLLDSSSGGKRLAYESRAIPKAGWQSVQYGFFRRSSHRLRRGLQDFFLACKVSHNAILSGSLPPNRPLPQIAAVRRTMN